MSLKNTVTEYGAVTKIFHWTIALLVICLLIVGLTMDELPMGSLKLEVYTLHKSFGMTVLALMIGRICWHIYNRRPDEVAGLPRWQKIAAQAVHYSLYLLLLAQPLTGWLLSSAAGRPVSFFGLFTLPDLVPVDKAASKIYAERHETIGYLIMIVVGLHVAAALKHHFIDKDIVLKRMMPVLAFAAMSFFVTPASADIPHWSLVHGKSSITFRPKQMGTEFKGTFDVFSAVIAFDPDNLAESKASIHIQLGTAHTGAPDRDGNLKGKEWLDVARFPEAKFETKSIQKAGANTYKAEGTLTIRNISLPVTLPFTLVITSGEGGKIATMDGTVILDRSKFQIGTGQWADTSIIANEVPVDIHVEATVTAPLKSAK